MHPHYRQLVEVALKDSARNRAVLLQAYGYLGAYEANIKSDYVTSLGYFNRILDMDPDNREASKYSGILINWIAG